jgi:hypothetical protein
MARRRFFAGCIVVLFPHFPKKYCTPIAKNARLSVKTARISNAELSWTINRRKKGFYAAFLYPG